MKKVIFTLLVTLLLFVHVPSVAAQSTGTGDMCCPPGYANNVWSCPFSELGKPNICCKRVGFGKYITIPKVSCSSITDQPQFQSALDLCVFTKDQAGCIECALSGGLSTAIGCIPINSPSGLFGTLLSFAIGLAGGIAFLLMLFGALQIMTSAGNPEKLNAGKELITSAITGLFLIIFSIFLLRLIGYNILGIPGFG